MAEIVEDGDGAKRAFSNLAMAAAKLASVASTDASWLDFLDAVFDVIRASFREVRR
jgi:hypothetical protein